MKSVVSILLVEDDTRTCRELEDCLDGESELELLGITSSSIEAFQMVCDMLPDVIILDLELHEGGGSGLSLLKALQNAPVDVHPYADVSGSERDTHGVYQRGSCGGRIIRCLRHNGLRRASPMGARPQDLTVLKEVDRRHACSLITAWSFLRRRRADPNRDPNAEKSRWIQADTVDRPPSRKHAKAPESVAAQRFPALIVSSHAGGHWFESSSLHQIPKSLLDNGFGIFLFPDSYQILAF